MLDNDGDTLVDEPGEDLLAFDFGPVAPERLIGLTFEITEGTGAGQGRVIESAVIIGRNGVDDDDDGDIDDLDELLVLITLDVDQPGDPTNLDLDPASSPWEIVPDGTSRFAISTTNPNFFAVEEEQVDLLLIFNDDSVAERSDTRRNPSAEGISELPDPDRFGLEDAFDAPEDTLVRLGGLGMGPNIRIGDVAFPGGITQSGIETTKIFLGKGPAGGILVLDDVAARPAFDAEGFPVPEEELFRTVTEVHAGPGDDLIRISLQRSDGLIGVVDGAPFPVTLVSVDGATGNDEIVQWLRLEAPDPASVRLTGDAKFTLRITTDMVKEFDVVLPAARTVNTPLTLDVEFEAPDRPRR